MPRPPETFPYTIDQFNATPIAHLLTRFGELSLFKASAGEPHLGELRRHVEDAIRVIKGYKDEDTIELSAFTQVQVDLLTQGWCSPRIRQRGQVDRGVMLYTRLSKERSNSNPISSGGVPKDLFSPKMMRMVKNHVETIAEKDKNTFFPRNNAPVTIMETTATSPRRQPGSASTTASTIVFASNRNPALARGSVRASTVADLLSDAGEDGPANQRQHFIPLTLDG